MKKFKLPLSILLIVISSSLSLVAQFEIGLTVGGNLSGLNYISIGQTDNQFEDIQRNIEERTATSTQPGFQGGFYIDFQRERFSISPELLYTNRAYSGKEFTHRNEYLTIPIRFKYKIAEQWSLDLGPEFNCIIWNSYIFSSMGQGFHELYRKVEVAASMGATYKFPYRGRLSVRYLQGLSDMIASVHLPVSQRSRSIQMSFSYAIFDWEG